MTTLASRLRRRDGEHEYCYDTHDLQSDSDVEASDSGCEEDDTPPSCGAMQVEHASVVAEE